MRLTTLARSFWMRNPFRYFNSSHEIIRLTVIMYIRYPLSLRQFEDLLFERGTDICHVAVRFWWNPFGPMFAQAKGSLSIVFELALVPERRVRADRPQDALSLATCRSLGGALEGQYVCY